MDPTTAKALLHDERVKVESLLQHLTDDRSAERVGADAQGDMNDAAEPLIAEQEGDAVAQGLELRLAAILRAEARVADGSYGVSVQSGLPISDERLQADPAVELTFDEAIES